MTCFRCALCGDGIMDTDWIDHYWHAHGIRPCEPDAFPPMEPEPIPSLEIKE